MANSPAEGLGPRLLDTLRQFPGPGKLYIAFSGGADSTALLAATCELKDHLDRELTAVHVNHGVHPRAAQWAEHCQAVCRQLDVLCQVLAAKHPLSDGQGPEARLREARYQLLAGLLQPGDLLLTAHHREDQAETLLLNLLRGSGTAGLAGMPGSRPLGQGLLLRPWLDESRQALRASLDGRGLQWIEDPSNADTRLDRNFLRHDILPRLVQRWPAAVGSLAQSARHSREVAGLLAELAQSLLDTHLESPGVLQLAPELLQDRARLLLVLRQWLANSDCAPPPRRQLEEFARQAESARADAAIELAWSGHRLRCWQQRLWLQQQELPPCPLRDWNGSQALELDVGLGHLELCGPLSAFPWPLKVRPRSGGERIAGAGGHSQAVKELLRSAGIPPWLRDRVPLLVRGEEVLAVGDWQLAPELRAWLDAAGLQLRWSADDPLLAQLQAECYGGPVETAP
jgi:tRNA(Ile)-lysidine synthase